jgi:hypothetical protein
MPHNSAGAAANGKGSNSEKINDQATEVTGTGVPATRNINQGRSCGASPIKRKRRSNAELEDLDAAIIEAVRAEHPVTLRGVYYRVVSAGAVEKTEQGYRVVGRQLLKLRRSGEIPYSWITDGTRWITKPETWSDLDEMLADAASSYRRALWHDSADEVAIFTEKDAISGVILPITSKWDVPLGVLRGYSSESFAHSVAQGIIASNAYRSGTAYVYQLGDHDPSGVGAWADFTEKVTAFINETREDAADYVHFERIAVTEEQIGLYELPTRPTKSSDTRAAKFTGASVEVDAIPPSTLREIVEDHITLHVDTEALRLTRIAEESEREILSNMRGGDWA